MWEREKEVSHWGVSGARTKRKWKWGKRRKKKTKSVDPYDDLKGKKKKDRESSPRAEKGKPKGNIIDMHREVNNAEKNKPCNWSQRKERKGFTPRKRGRIGNWTLTKWTGTHEREWKINIIWKGNSHQNEEGQKEKKNWSISGHAVGLRKRHNGHWKGGNIREWPSENSGNEKDLWKEGRRIGELWNISKKKKNVAEQGANTWPCLEWETKIHNLLVPDMMKGERGAMGGVITKALRGGKGEKG